MTTGSQHVLHDRPSQLDAETPLRDRPALELKEADYQFGMGPIVIRVKTMIERQVYRDEPWIFVEAEVAQGTENRHGPFLNRLVYVRERNLIEHALATETTVQ